MFPGDPRELSHVEHESELNCTGIRFVSAIVCYLPLGFSNTFWHFQFTLILYIVAEYTDWQPIEYWGFEWIQPWIMLTRHFSWVYGNMLNTEKELSAHTVIEVLHNSFHMNCKIDYQEFAATMTIYPFSSNNLSLFLVLFLGKTRQYYECAEFGFGSSC